MFRLAKLILALLIPGVAAAQTITCEGISSCNYLQAGTQPVTVVLRVMSGNQPQDGRLIHLTSDKVQPASPLTTSAAVATSSQAPIGSVFHPTSGPGLGGGATFRLSPEYELTSARETHDFFLRMLYEHEEFEVETDRAGEGTLGFWSDTMRSVIVSR